ncbi:hypothetical protein SDC9_88890 [bioreactor metagenome]|uniref:Uncharacterized protein n=1 Tax=bioreactor metagenome TaxID=1076179 RepID=A0A644ZNC0_9ZZZZ
MHESTAFLLLEVRGGSAAHVVAAVEVHLDHGVPLVQAHLVKEAIAQNARVVDHAVDAAKAVERALHDAPGARSIGHAVGVGHGLAACGLDLFDHLVGGAGIGALAVGGGADVVDHHLGAFGGHRQCHVAPDAAAGARDHDHFSVHHLLCHCLVFLRCVCVRVQRASMRPKPAGGHSRIKRPGFVLLKPPRSALGKGEGFVGNNPALIAGGACRGRER